MAVVDGGANRCTGKMEGEEDVFHLFQWAGIGQRLDFEDVQSGACKPFFLACFYESRLIDDFAAGRVDEERGLPHEVDG